MSTELPPERSIPTAVKVPLQQHNITTDFQTLYLPTDKFNPCTKIHLDVNSVTSFRLLVQ